MQEMSDESIADKHKRIRGTHDLKYPGNKSRCKSTCGIAHDWIMDINGREHPRQHRCYLAIDHKDPYCQFSSQCGERRIRPVANVTHETSLADDGFETLKTEA